MPNDNIDPMIRARFHAIELLLAQLIADRLVLEADSAISAAELLTRLMAKADRMKLRDANAGEDTGIREEIGYNLFETLNAALNLAGERQGSERQAAKRGAGGEIPASTAVRPAGGHPTVLRPIDPVLLARQVDLFW